MFAASGDGEHNPAFFREQSATSSNTSETEVRCVKLVSELREVCDEIRSEIADKFEWKKRLDKFPATLPDFDEPQRFDPDLDAVRARALAAVQSEIDLVSTMSREQYEAGLQRSSQLRALELTYTKQTERVRQAQDANNCIRAVLRQIDSEIDQRLHFMRSEVANPNGH